ncbi:unnamed protein product [Parnassius apollo]|uniref:(apollo) hypothetical protein n=1 Tax=Parnassius apollo TaxID=110799 RepID=A0A8S3X0W1_PARAO|nr:unnamed protein product [Parnassius apollo]
MASRSRRIEPRSGIACSDDTVLALLPKDPTYNEPTEIATQERRRYDSSSVVEPPSPALSSGPIIRQATGSDLRRARSSRRPQMSVQPTYRQISSQSQPVDVVELWTGNFEPLEINLYEPTYVPNFDHEWSYEQFFEQTYHPHELRTAATAVSAILTSPAPNTATAIFTSSAPNAASAVLTSTATDAASAVFTRPATDAASATLTSSAPSAIYAVLTSPTTDAASAILTSSAPDAVSDILRCCIYHPHKIRARRCVCRLHETLYRCYVCRSHGIRDGRCVCCMLELRDPDASLTCSTQPETESNLLGRSLRDVPSTFFYSSSSRLLKTMLNIPLSGLLPNGVATPLTKQKHIDVEQLTHKEMGLIRRQVVCG